MWMGIDLSCINCMAVKQLVNASENFARKVLVYLPVKYFPPLLYCPIL